MASTYNETGINSDALQAVIGAGLFGAGILTDVFLSNLDKERGDPVTQVLDDFRSINSVNEGTDVAIINSGGTVNLSELDSRTIKDLNALIFSTESNVNLFMDRNFKGTVSFGAGDDTYFYNGSKAQTILAGDGNDTIFTGSGKDTIEGGAGNDSIVSGNGNDSITAGDGNDTIKAGNGNDTIHGGNGNDFIDGGNGNDSITAGAGDDSIIAGNGNDTIVTGNGNDTVDAGAGNDRIIVNTSGAEGNSQITIDGGAGKDLLHLLDAGVIGGSVDTDTKTAVINLADGTTLDVSNVESFLVEGSRSINLVGLEAYFDGLS